MASHCKTSVRHRSRWYFPIFPFDSRRVCSFQYISSWTFICFIMVSCAYVLCTVMVSSTYSSSRLPIRLPLRFFTTYLPPPIGSKSSFLFWTDRAPYVTSIYMSLLAARLHQEGRQKNVLPLHRHIISASERWGISSILVKLAIFAHLTNALIVPK